MIKLLPNHAEQLEDFLEQLNNELGNAEYFYDPEDFDVEIERLDPDIDRSDILLDDERKQSPSRDKYLSRREIKSSSSGGDIRLPKSARKIDSADEKFYDYEPCDCDSSDECDCEPWQLKRKYRK